MILEKYSDLNGISIEKNAHILFVTKAIVNKDTFNNAYNIIYGSTFYHLITLLLNKGIDRKNVDIINPYYTKPQKKYDLIIYLENTLDFQNFASTNIYIKNEAL